MSAQRLDSLRGVGEERGLHCTEVDMNLSTEGVTLRARCVFKLVDQYEHLESAVRPIFELASGLDRKEPSAPAPLKVYNDICEWLEKQYGPASLREAGRALGKSIYDELVREGKVGLRPTPNALFEELRRMVANIVADPLRRGWEIVESADQKVRLRRTQTFNCMLQEGLLYSLLERTGALLPRVNHVRCTRTGAPYCEYEALWLKARVRALSRFASAKAG